MKKVMILGAGIYQLPLILQAKRMGLYTVVVSRDGNYPGFQVGDKIYKIDTRDQEAVLSAAREEQIHGICTSGTDVAVRTIGYVCQELGLWGIGREAARIVTDKKEMKEAFWEHKVRTADFRVVRSMEEARVAAGELGFPLVLKAVDNSGSRGVYCIRRLDELMIAYRDTRQYTAKPYLLMEKYIQGTEIGVDAFVLQGKVVLMLPHDKLVYHVDDGVTVPVGHHFPYRCSPELLEEIRIQMERAIAATGMDNCPVNADVFVNGGQVSIIEVGGRCGATCIPELISMHCGFNYYEKMLQAALGEEVSFSYQESHSCMATLIFSRTDGTITDENLEILGQLKEQGVEAQIDYPKGTRISRFRNGTHRIGHVIAPTDDPDILEEMARKLRSNIWVDRQNFQEMWEMS